MPRSALPIIASDERSWSPQSQRSEPSKSPVRHSEWRRTRTDSAPSISPRDSATTSVPSKRNTLIRKSPQRVGSDASARETSAGEATSTSSIQQVRCHLYATCRSVVNELPGRIFIRGLRCRGRQGPAPAEQQQAHDYLVDVELSVDMADAVAKDDLAAALNIADVAACVRDEVARRPRVLL